MNRQRYVQIEDLFSAAIELPEPERRAFLAEACDGSPELLNDVERLLAAEAEATFLDRPVGRPPDDWQDFGRPERKAGQVYVVSTSAELESYRAIALRIVGELGYEAVQRLPHATPIDDPVHGAVPVSAVARQIARCDVVLAIVGWSCDLPPSPELGGDGIRPWSYWELHSAFECAKPVALLMADASLRPTSSNDTPDQTSSMADFRGELARLASSFGLSSADDALEDEDHRTTFSRRVRRQLLEARPKESISWSTPAPSPPATVRLRQWPSPTLPERPYPLLLPYSHPALLAGRDHDLDELCRLLRQPVPILGLAAPSGTGKSSVLVGGLVPLLRRQGHPVALERHPLEPEVTYRLLSDLLHIDDTLSLDLHDPEKFIAHLLIVRRLAEGRTPILIIDQFEDLLRPSRRAAAEAHRARAVMGTLLAASAQRLPGLEEPPCRWILSCRQEIQGQLFQWLSDLLVEARAEGLAGVEALPHDFSGAERFRSWPLRPLAVPSPATDDAMVESTAVFLAAIEQPLQLLDERGEAQYPWRFAGDGAKRLAQAFASARIAQPEAPLVPELQAVLTLLLDEAGEPLPGEVSVVHVPSDPETLIDRALEEHLGRALDAAFPTALTAHDRVLRTRALLALRELADTAGRREQGLPVEALARAIGIQGDEVLARLATPQTRLVTLEQRDGEWIYVLAHDRLAEVLVRLFEEGRYPGMRVDAELLGLRRFVILRSALFAAGDTDQATEVQSDSFRKIEKNHEAILWGEAQQDWWQASRRRWQQTRHRKTWRRSLGVALTMLFALIVWNWTSQRAREQALFAHIVAGEPPTAFEALVRLHSPENVLRAQRLQAQWSRRERPFDVFDQGIGGVAKEHRSEAVLRIATLARPLFEAAPEDPVRIASLVWALDFFPGRDPELAEQARELRQEILRPLWQRYPPPTVSNDDNDNDGWVDIPAGTFWMGSSPEDGRNERDMLDERPRHQVTLSTFRIQNHEVTNAEYRRLKPDHQGADGLAATHLSWYKAYTYAAWIGGRLPTEAEWEYAARAQCPHTWCRRDGSEATVDEVAWWRGSRGLTTPGQVTPMPVMQLEPNPWGLFDMFGNVGEWNADWYDLYPRDHVTDPTGPTFAVPARRKWRGGNIFQTKDWVEPSARGGQIPNARGSGFRVVLAPYG